MPTTRTPELGLHSRVIEHLGVDMCQSPTTAPAVPIANAWQTNADSVSVTLHGDEIDADSVIVMNDGGVALTFVKRQSRCRSRLQPLRRRSSEPAFGRSRHVIRQTGIGKLAGPRHCGPVSGSSSGCPRPRALGRTSGSRCRARPVEPSTRVARLTRALLARRPPPCE